MKCKVNSESVKVEMKNQLHYTYHDVVVSCSEKKDENNSIKYPILVVEVLSGSTREYDFNEKFTAYKQINSLRYYVFVEQERCFVTVFSKHQGFWAYKAYSEYDDNILFEHLLVEIEVKEIYDNIEFPENMALYVLA